jgi:hypothetical protein
LLFLADVKKVIFRAPDFAAIAGPLGELANVVCVNPDAMDVTYTP